MGKTSRDKRDIFYRLAKEEGWRARSAYKLLQIDEKFHIFQDRDGKPLERVVDLCAAPGSWSQVLSKKLWEPVQNENVKIVAVDLQAIGPIPGVAQIQGDITTEETAKRIIECFPPGTRAQMVVCDGAPDVTGMHELDQFVQFQLIKAALGICERILETGGRFIAKVFRGRESPLLSQLRLLFSDRVVIAKPRSSRNSSLEAFIVCEGFNGMSVFNLPEQPATALEVAVILPFVTCGDLSGFDADTCYPLGEDYVPRDPVQPPIDPAYAESCRKAKYEQQTSKATLNSQQIMEELKFI